MDGSLCIFDGLDVLVHMLCNMDPKAPSGKQYNQHPYLVLNHLITKKLSFLGDSNQIVKDI